MAKNQNGEAGYLLIAVLFVMALLLFALATAAPRVSYDLRRDRELETVHRGMQYARAIKLYYRKFGHYPVSLDELKDTNHLRFLRRMYADPMTGKQDWRLIHMGESKTLSVGGPRGQVGVPAGQLGLNGGASGGPGGGPGGLLGGGGQGGPTFGTPGLPGGQTSGGIVVGNAPAGGNPAGSGASGDLSGSGPSNSRGVSGSSSGLGGTGLGGTGLGGRSPGLGNSSSGQPGDAAPGSTFGGGPILGVSSTNPKTSILILKKMQHYNEWEFIYDPSLDLGGGGANGLQGATPVSGQNPFQSTGGQGQQNPTPTPAPDPNAPAPPNPPSNPNQ